MHSNSGVRVVAALVAVMAVAAWAAGSASASASAAPGLQINVLSTRADLVSGGQVLASIGLPRGADPSTVTVTLNGANVTSEFAERANGEFEGLLGGLVNGPNTVTASLPDGTSASSTITNHPIGGPIFSGPQVQPWV